MTSPAIPKGPIKQQVIPQPPKTKSPQGSENYKVPLFCTNCGYQQINVVDIPKGIKVWPGSSGEKCEKCGCFGTLARSILY